MIPFWNQHTQPCIIKLEKGRNCNFLKIINFYSHPLYVPQLTLWGPGNKLHSILNTQDYTVTGLIATFVTGYDCQNSSLYWIGLISTPQLNMSWVGSSHHSHSFYCKCLEALPLHTELISCGLSLVFISSVSWPGLLLLAGPRQSPG